MKSGIISDSVKLFMAHFCHQAGADPVGWVVREGGLSSVGTRQPSSLPIRCLIRKVKIIRVKIKPLTQLVFYLIRFGPQSVVC